MHSYLCAVGFSNIKNRNELESILGRIMDRPHEKRMSKINDTTTLTEMKLDFAPNMGISVCGEYDEHGVFHMDHYFPYFKGRRISIKEEICINRRVDTEAYTGMCDDNRLGVSLIFYLQNGLEDTWKLRCLRYQLMVKFFWEWILMRRSRGQEQRKQKFASSLLQKQRWGIKMQLIV